MNRQLLEDIIDKHKLWLEVHKVGVKANLFYANLSDANLSGADLGSANIIVIQLPFYTAYIQKEHTQIGCKYFSNEEWCSFTDEEIAKMDDNALEFWNNYKDVIFAAMESLK